MPASRRAAELTTTEDAPVVEAPADLAAALAGSAAAREAWEQTGPARRLEYVAYLDDATQPDVRARRVGSSVEMLVAFARARATRTAR
jgi:uncharacterized protein YdeI (YjbR/CyaY-like superfamily)